jgi:hypothetical protein
VAAGKGEGQAEAGSEADQRGARQVSGRPFRLKAPVTPEDQLQETVARALDVLLLPPAMHTHFPAGSVPLPPQFAAKLLRFGLKRGWPDFLIVHRGIYGIELKRADGVLSRTRTVRTKRGALRVIEGQRETFPRLLEAGFAGLAVCRSVDEVIDQLRHWNVPVRLTHAMPPLWAANEAPRAV